MVSKTLSSKGLFTAALSAIAFATCIAFTACDDSSTVKEPSPDAGGSSGASGDASSGSSGSSSGTDGGDGGPTDCVVNPTTHLEIINACTNATRITKNPTLTKLLPDGGLPPLN